jgi:hypothetical protein
VAQAMETGLMQPKLTEPKLIDTGLMEPELTEPDLMGAKLYFPEPFPVYSPVAFAALFAAVHELLWQRL